jgi:hypothetical protein
MPRARRLALALITASLLVPTGALAQGAGGAGDDQYTDPFAGNSSTSGSGNDNNGSGDQNGSDNGLSENPDLSGNDTGTSTSGTGTGTDTGTPGTGTATALANTGSDLRLMILAGLTLVLAGTGLRMRTADEEF